MNFRPSQAQPAHHPKGAMVARSMGAPNYPAMKKPRFSAEALAYLAACRRDLLDLRRGAAQTESETEEARRKHKAAKLERFVARKRGSKGFGR